MFLKSIWQQESGGGAALQPGEEAHPLGIAEAGVQPASAVEPEHPNSSPAQERESGTPDSKSPQPPLPPDEALARAETFASEQRHDQVIELLEPWLPVDPEHARGWALLAVAYFGLSRWTDAERAASCYVGLQPEDPTAYANWGATLRKLGRFSAARAAQGKALALDPDYQYARQELRKIARDEAR